LLNDPTCGRKQRVGIFRIQPVNARVFPEPGELALGIAAAFPGDVLFCFLQAALPVEVSEEFLIADGLQCRPTGLHGPHPGGLLQKALLQHQFHPQIDAGIKRRTIRPVQADLHRVIPGRTGRGAAIPLAYCALMSTGVAYTLQIVGQKFSANPTLAAIIFSTESVFAALGGMLLLNERMTVQGYIGCVLIFTGIVLSQWTPKKYSKE